jgi:uncharacterized protein
MAILSVAGLAAFCLVPGSAKAAGFDCAKASAPDERAVCSDPQLSSLDSEMTGLWYAYSKVPMLMGGNGERQTEAEQFLATRRKCGSDAACLGRAYAARITQLQNDVTSAMQGFQQFVWGDGNPCPKSP